MKKNIIIKLSLVASMLSLGISAQAVTTSSNFQAAATLGATCQLFATNINYTNLTPAPSGTATATGTITAICTRGSPYVLDLNSGSSSSFANRTMTGATSGNTDKLNYNIYTDSSYATVLGDTTSNTGHFSGIGNGGSQFYTMYSKAPLTQYVTPDSYADNLTVTLTY